MPNKIINIIAKSSKSFGVSELPNIKKFILDNHEEILKEIFERDNFKDNFLSNDSSKHHLLMINFMVNPNLFYCHRDSVKGRYKRYFQPIYFSDEIRKIIKLKKDISSADLFNMDKAIVAMHEEFDRHYSNDIKNREFLSLNDLETISNAHEFEKHSFPSPGSIIGFLGAQHTGSHDNLYELKNTTAFKAHYEPFFSGASSDVVQIDNLLEKQSPKNVEKFINYLNYITLDKELIYYQYVAGANNYWYGKCFFALKLPERPNSPILEIGLLEELVHAAEHVLSALVLMGTTIRNPRITAMIEDYRRMMTSIERYSRPHESLWRQYGRSNWEVNQEPFSNFFEILKDNNKHSITGKSKHILKEFWSHTYEKIQEDSSQENHLEHMLKRVWFESSSIGYQAWQNDMRHHLGVIFGAQLDRKRKNVMNYYADSIAFGHWAATPYKAMERFSVFESACDVFDDRVDPFVISTVALLFHFGMVGSNLKNIFGVDKNINLSFDSPKVTSKKYDSNRDGEAFSFEILHSVDFDNLEMKQDEPNLGMLNIEIRNEIGMKNIHRHQFKCVLLFANTFLRKVNAVVISGKGKKIFSTAYFGDEGLLKDSIKSSISSSLECKVWSRYILYAYV